MGSSLAWAMICDRGTVRSENQDATLMIAGGTIVILPAADRARDATGGSAAFSVVPGGPGRPVLAAVADGMGGPPGGAQASQVIVRTIADRLPSTAVDDPLFFLRGLLEESDRAVFALAERHGLTGMGSTCTLLMLQDGHAHLCHVGDSRCYRIRPAEGMMSQWSRDQNVAAEMMHQGLLSADEARHHRASHTLTQAVGLGKTLEPHCDSTPLTRDGQEVFLLCSDGLLRVFGDDEILAVVRDRIVAPDAKISGASDLITIARDLVGLANRRGSPDNISVVLLRLSP